jgi:tetratricopeptide (TPR) repeat protein
MLPGTARSASLVVACLLTAAPARATTVPRLDRPLVWFLPAARATLEGKPDANATRRLFWQAEQLLPGEPQKALSLYQQILAAKDAQSDLQAAALFRAALASFRLDRSTEAAGLLDRLLRGAPPQGGVRQLLRQPATEMLALVFGDFLWNGKERIPDLSPPPRPAVTKQRRKDGRVVYVIAQELWLEPKVAIANLRRFFAGREKEPHVRPLYRAVAELFASSTRDDGALELIRVLLEQWPSAPDNGSLWDLRAQVLEHQRLFKEASQVRAERARRFPEAAAPASRPAALRVPSTLLDDALQRRAARAWLKCARQAAPFTPVPSATRLRLTLDEQGRVRGFAHTQSRWPATYFQCLERELRGLTLDTGGLGGEVQALVLLL